MNHIFRISSSKSIKNIQLKAFIFVNPLNLLFFTIFYFFLLQKIAFLRFLTFFYVKIGKLYFELYSMRKMYFFKNMTKIAKNLGFFGPFEKTSFYVKNGEFT